MTPPPKLEELPLKIAKLKSSTAWHLPDFAFCWYVKLLIEATDNTSKPGYLPDSIDELWQIAGARTREFALRRFEIRLPGSAGQRGRVLTFEKGLASLVDLYFVRIADESGKWIYNRRLLAVISERLDGGCQNPSNPIATMEVKQAQKKAQKIRLYIGNSFVVSIYKHYPRHIGKDKAYKAIEKAIQRLAESKCATFTDHNGIEQSVLLTDSTDAAQFISAAALEFNESPAGHKRNEDGNSVVPYPATWMNQGRYLDDRREWWDQAVPRASRSGPPQIGLHEEPSDPEAAAAYAALREKFSAGEYGKSE